MTATQAINTRRIAMFGATQGVTLEALKSVLNRTEHAEPVHLYIFLRSPEKLHLKLTEAGFNADLVLKQGHGSTKLTTFKGDALRRDDVSAFFKMAVKDGPLTEVISSLGATMRELVFVWYKPFSPPRFTAEFTNICSDTMRNILDALRNEVAPGQPDGLAPRLIVVASNGIGQSTHDALPWLLKPFYGQFLRYPHMDKEKMECYLHRSYAIQSVDFNPEPKNQTALQGLSSDRLIVVRPSLLTNGEAKGAVRISSTVLPKAWTVSRSDVGSFITGDCIKLTKPIADTPVEGGHGYTVSY